MADAKISALPASTTPLAGTEVLPVVQSGATKQVSVANLTAGRAVSMSTLTTTGKTAFNGASIVSSRVQNIRYDHATDDVFVLNDSNASPWANWAFGPGSGTGLDTFNFYRTGVGTIVSFGNGLANINTPTTVAGDVTVNSGNLVQGTAAKGVNFTANTPAAGMTSQLLNWYEEGTWTPNQGAELTLVGDFSSSGTYTRIGRQVFVRGSVSGATSVAVASAGVISTNLPYSAGADATGAAVNAANNASSVLRISSATLTAVTAIAATTTITFSATYSV